MLPSANKRKPCAETLCVPKLFRWWKFDIEESSNKNMTMLITLLEINDLFKKNEMIMTSSQQKQSSLKGRLLIPYKCGKSRKRENFVSRKMRCYFACVASLAWNLGRRVNVVSALYKIIFQQKKKGKNETINQASTQSYVNQTIILT